MRSQLRAQSAVEYLLLLAVVGAVVMISFRFLLPQTQFTTEDYFNTVARAIVEDDHPVTSIDGDWCGLDGKPLKGRTEVCSSSAPCGANVLYRSCACPEPMFGGKHCVELDPCNSVIICKAKQACVDCTGKPDPCLAPIPEKCGTVTNGLTQCSQQACTQYNPCGQCGGTPNPLAVGECPGATVEVPNGTQWTTVDSADNCSDNQTKCRKYLCPSGKKLVSGSCVTI